MEPLLTEDAGWHTVEEALTGVHQRWEIEQYKSRQSKQ
jgi:hypothetical protein